MRFNLWHQRHGRLVGHLLRELTKRGTGGRKHRSCPILRPSLGFADRNAVALRALDSGQPVISIGVVAPLSHLFPTSFLRELDVRTPDQNQKTDRFAAA